MTNFAQTMHDWQRMCKYFDKYYHDDCCKYCPLGSCDAIWAMDDITNWEDFEKKIADFAKTHPEPKYPSWREYLKKMGLITSTNVYFSDDAEFRLNDTLNENADLPIPAEIATALGLEPKHD